MTDPETSAAPATEPVTQTEATPPADRDAPASTTPEATSVPPAESDVPAPEPTDDPLFEAMWTKVLSSWDEDKIHGAILEYSVTAEKLPDLAGRYRALKDDPAKGERAKKRLDAIVLAATSLMMSMKTPANTTIPLPITLSVGGIFLCAVAFAAYAMLHR